MIRKVALALGVLLAALLLAESAARAWLHWLANEAQYQSYASLPQLRARYGDFERFHAHRHFGFALAPGYVRGANRHGARGLRGAEIDVGKREGSQRIVCCGGSTVYGEGVDDWRLSMPALLEQALRGQGRDVDVINAGCPGWTSLESLLHFEADVLDLSPDHVVIYHGINDVLPRVVWPASAYRGDWSGWLCREQHLAEASLLELSTLARIVLVSRGELEPHGSLLRVVGDRPASSHSFQFREQRQRGTYPDGIFRDVSIEQMLAANPPSWFERNLRSMLAVANAHGVHPVLCTFAFSTHFPDDPLIGHPAVQAAIEQTNTIVRRLGAATGTPVVDVAAALAKKELFTDGVHFTAAGNVAFAALLQEHFRAPPR